MINFTNISDKAYTHCRDIKDRPSVRKYITEEEHLKNYQDWKKQQ